VVWIGGEARKQKWRLEGRAVGAYLLGGLQNIENEEECIFIGSTSEERTTNKKV
jgi:hypothetical protein